MDMDNKWELTMGASGGVGWAEVSKGGKIWTTVKNSNKIFN